MIFGKILLTNEHLFYNYFVRLSVGKGFATYGRTRPVLNIIDFYDAPEDIRIIGIYFCFTEATFQF